MLVRVSRKMLLVGMLIVVMSLVSSRYTSSTTYAEGYDWHADDPLLYEHVVVEGVITDVELKEVDSKKLDIYASGPKGWIGVLQLEDVKTLRGAELHLPLSVKLFFDWRDAIGKRVVLCARWWPELDSYLVLKEEAVFVATTSAWERMGPKEVLTDAELSARVAEVQPSSVAGNADIVVLGTIEALEDSTVLLQSKYRGSVTKVAIRREEVVAGSVREPLVHFNAYNWTARIPQLGIGERWVVFLEEKDGALWVVGGSNGLYRVGDRGELFYDGVARHTLSESQLIRLVKKEKHVDN